MHAHTVSVYSYSIVINSGVYGCSSLQIAGDHRSSGALTVQLVDVELDAVERAVRVDTDGSRLARRVLTLVLVRTRAPVVAQVELCEGRHPPVPAAFVL